MSGTSVLSSSGTLSIRSNPLNLFVTLYNRQGFLNEGREEGGKIELMENVSNLNNQE